MIKNPVTTFMAIFGISTSYLTTYLNLRKIEDGKLSPSTNPPTRIIKKNGFEKGGLPMKNRGPKFHSPEQYSKRKSIGPHGSASTSLRGIKNNKKIYVWYVVFLNIFCDIFCLRKTFELSSDHYSHLGLKKTNFFFFKIICLADVMENRVYEGLHQGNRPSELKSAEHSR